MPQDEKKGWWDRLLKGCQLVLPAIVGLAVVVVAFILIVRIVFFPIEIGTEVDPDVVLLDSGERLIQMVQWTLSTILVVAGGLIGINWYRDEQRYKRDREEVENALAKLEEFKSTTQPQVSSVLEHALVTTVEDTARRIVDARSATDKYWVLIRGYQRVVQLEKPATFRTGHLVSNGIRFIARYVEETGQYVEVQAVPEQDASERFLHDVETMFPHLGRAISSLRESIRYG